MTAGVTHDTADFVWAGSVLHCMPEEDCRAFLKSAYQLLKPGGFLYGMTAGKHESSEWTYSTDGTLTGFLYSPVHPLHHSVFFITVSSSSQCLFNHSIFFITVSSSQYLVYLHWTVYLLYNTSQHEHQTGRIPNWLS